MPTDFATLCRQEVAALHQFFEDWFNGVLEKEERPFTRLTNVLAPGFGLVAPDGRLVARELLCAALRPMHGAWQNGRITIKNFQVRQESGDFLIATYEEWQQIGAETTVRLSTVVFARQPALENGVAWLHVHETWLAQ